MNKSWDLTLQVLFVAGLILVAMTFYFTRLTGIYAGDQLTNKPQDPYANYLSAYQFEQDEIRISTKINILKSEYASDLVVFTQQLAKIEQLEGVSELEKREKTKVLKELYSDQYFQRKLDLIDQEKAKLEKLMEAKCQKFCSYQDLPDAS